MKKIMIFIEGTAFYTKPVLFLFSRYGYAPIGEAKQIINGLYDKGNEIYLCSYVRKKRYLFIKRVMDFHGIKYTQILCRGKREGYADLVERIRPDILIEDDCKSIGGEKNWCITCVNKALKEHIESIIVEEFAGIDGIDKLVNLQ